MLSVFIFFVLQWNVDEVYRFVMKWYGGEPG
jgi:hypothetical protein